MYDTFPSSEDPTTLATLMLSGDLMVRAPAPPHRHLLRHLEQKFHRCSIRHQILHGKTTSVRGQSSSGIKRSNRQVWMVTEERTRESVVVSPGLRPESPSNPLTSQTRRQCSSQLTRPPVLPAQTHRGSLSPRSRSGSCHTRHRSHEIEGWPPAASALGQPPPTAVCELGSPGSRR